MAQLADTATNINNVQGFEFRNNGGRLEVLVQGEWLSVGEKKYTVVRQGVLTQVEGGGIYSNNCLENVEFKNSVSIINTSNQNLDYLIQTEK